MSIELGIDSFVIAAPCDAHGVARGHVEQMRDLIAEIELADRVGLDAYGIGEHHRKEFFDSAPVVILAAAAARTQRIRLTSAVTVLGASDPVRLFQEFATLDLISAGRAEMIVGRGSSIEAFPLFGFDLRDYDALFIEKLQLLLKLRDGANVHWSGKYRPPLMGQGVYPRPAQAVLPIRIGVGGTPASFERAGRMGLPLTVAIIGGSHAQFRPLIELYRRAGADAGHPPETLSVGIHSIGYVSDTKEQAADEFFPGYEKMIRELGRERGWSPPTREIGRAHV